MRKPTTPIHSRQDFLERQAQHQMVLRRNRRNGFRYVAALNAIGCGLSWDGKQLRLHGRLPARSRHRLMKLGVHVIHAIETLSQVRPDAPCASELVQ